MYPQDHIRDKQFASYVYWLDQRNVYYASQSAYELVGDALNLTQLFITFNTKVINNS